MDRPGSQLNHPRSQSIVSGHCFAAAQVRAIRQVMALYRGGTQQILDPGDFSTELLGHHLTILRSASNAIRG
ncbi:MAG TPA: hypothetical protein VGG72_25710 [Bryobacteraceae bacterium]|jgi:hypothetical protein